MFDYFGIILAFAVVIALLFVTTKFLAYKSKKMTQGNYMQIVESLSLGVNNRLHLVKVGDEFLILSASNKNVEFLARVNINDYKEEELKNPISEVIDFKSVLKKYMGGISFGNQSVKGPKAEEAIYRKDSSKSDEMAMSSAVFKNNLERLKNLNNSIDDKGHRDEQKSQN